MTADFGASQTRSVLAFAGHFDQSMCQSSLGWAAGAVGFTYSATSPMRAITSGDFSVTDFGFTEILASVQQVG